MALALVRTVGTFPSASLASRCGGLPVEVSLIAQLGIGGGDQLIAAASKRQRGHSAYVDALDEPSARLGGTDLAKGDATSLYSFAVGAGGHPFHRHAGHRMFTAISGSAGTQLRFSTVSPEQLAEDPRRFLSALEQVNIPPDSLFTVRFGGGTWHQFVPLHTGSSHPALFALSCHANELGGDLPASLHDRVMDNHADIPMLTELLPPAVLELLGSDAFDPARVPTIALSLDAPATSPMATLCGAVRGMAGRLRSMPGQRRRAQGFLAGNGGGRIVVAMDAPPSGSLLHRELPDGFDHQDNFGLAIAPGELATGSATVAMTALLEGFVENRPLGVSRMMTLRNALVKPLGLRTSALGCPVSSLLADTSGQRFAARFPVLAQRIDAGDTLAEVILGADDRHLRFRSCVRVELHPDGSATCMLATRVQTHNPFGRFYMRAIERVHRAYVSPAMLRLAVDHAVSALRLDNRSSGFSREALGAAQLLPT